MQHENLQEDHQSDSNQEIYSEDDSESDNIDNMLQEFDEDEGEDEDEVDEEEQIQHINVKPLKQNLIQQKMIKFYENYNSINPFLHFNLPKNKSVPKSVCAKVINKSEQIVECLDCGMDQSCIICMDCFKNSNHQGHRYMAKKAGGGCCDCGDAEAWKPSGFCKNHTGEFVEFEVQQQQINKYLAFTDGFFYYYLYLAARKDQQELERYSKYARKILQNCNKTSVYYNKLTTLALNRKLPENYNLNQEMNKKTILENIFTLSISGQEQFHLWWETVMNIFPYYPFKQIMVKYYFQNYDLIMRQNPKLGKNCATSITCQLLTSHKLVTMYSNQNTLPLAGNGRPPKQKSKMWDYYIILVHDLRLITDLQSTDAPISYWRMQINAGFDNIFHYQDQIYINLKKQANNPATKIMNDYIHFCQIEFTFLQTFIKVLHIIDPQPALLLKLINYFYRKLLKLPEEKRLLPTLRPYHRCFGLCLFKYFNYNLGNINGSKIQKLLKEIKKNQAEFFQIIKLSIKDIEETYFLYSKCLAETGIGQSLYGFCYFYRNKTPFIAYIDLLYLKMALLITEEPIAFSFRSTIDYDSFDLLPKENEQLYNQEKSKKRVYFDSVLSQLNYLLFSNIPDLYIYYRIERASGGEYKIQIQDLIQKAFKENGNKMSYEILKTLKETIFTNENKVLDHWIKNKTKYNKQRKQYELPEENIVPNSGVNFKNIWINLVDQNQPMLPSKSFDLIGQIQQKLWRIFFTEQTMLSLRVITEALFQSAQILKTSGSTTLEKIASFFYVLQKLQIGAQNNPIEQIYERNKESLPEKIAKQFGLISGNQEMNQKKKLMELKMKKLNSKKEKFKMNNDILLKNYENKGDTDLSLDTVNKEDVCCSICRNTDPTDFVYLGRTNIRNHQKLLGIGSLQCLSFSSCYHVFDKSCIKKNYNSKLLFDSISCPLCKSSANILVPYSINQEDLIREFLDRFTQIVFTLESKADLLVELCKSLYHYSLLASVNLKICIQKRRKIYKIIWEIFKKSVPYDQVSKLYTKFKKNEITRAYSQSEQANQQQGKGTAFLMQLFRGNPFTSVSILQDRIKRKKKSKEQEEKIKSPSQSNPTQFSQQYELTMMKIFKLLQCQDPTLVDLEFPPYIENCFGALQADINEEEIQDEPQAIKNILIEMPQKYSTIGSSLQCSSCKQISSDLMMCLLCKWVGCQNCPNGYFFEHTRQQHGCLNACMRIRDLTAVYAVNKQSIKIGYLYEHELEGGIKLDKEWDRFELNKELYDRIGRQILCDEIRISK